MAPPKLASRFHSLPPILHRPVQSPNTEADTEGKKLQNIITQVLGEKTKIRWEQLEKPLLGVEAKTIQDEMEARQGVAGTIYGLWVDGKLREKSDLEIEQLALNNAKTREERNKILKEMDMLEANLKGKTIQNAMDEMSLEMQKTLGIGKESPGWVQMFGRLLMSIIGK